MPLSVEYQDDDVVVTSRNPLKGLLPLASEEEDVELSLDKETAELLMSALLEFIMAGEGGDMPKISIGRR
ncbi:hypothetical protein [Mesorhizobium captivum]|uniref:hypothetical protein n=1 Tax=Mesorhizobium captivum TaxID=3072319 RepID=UPI002A23DBE9|nr:hypothetical protein [Mesorhizobium sp. VK3C]MDX8448284.1 hypothetical protein [Mesorhizobium sp. VK3C]